MSFEPDQIIDGKYRIRRVLGEGGMGAVYEGENVRIGRRVAIKVLHAEIANAPDLRRRFEREARVAAKIGSANICDVLDLGDLPSGEAYLVMEYLEGETLDDLMNREMRLQAHEIAPIVVQLLDGLSAMHGANIVHRDLKPANVFLTHAGVVKILDFGISKFQIQTEEMGQKTETGALLGTPLYMSPEQSRGLSDLDGRSDIYCVGVILYRALSGQHCFEAENLPQLLFKTALEAPIPLLPRVDAVDQSFVPIIEKAMAKAPGDRYATARDLRDAIDGWLREHHPEVVLPPAPARFEGILESSGARSRTGEGHRLGGSGARPKFESQGGGTPTDLKKPTLDPVEKQGHDTASTWENPQGPGGIAAEAFAKTSLAQMPPAAAASSNARYFAFGAIAIAIAIAGGAYSLRRPTAEAAATIKVAPPAPLESAAVGGPASSGQKEAVAASSVASTAQVEPATATASARPPSTGAPSTGAPSTGAATQVKATAKASAAPVTTPPPPEAASAAKPGRKIRTEL